MSDFNKFRDAVKAKFDKMTKNNQNVFFVDIDKHTIWDTYISAFPEGTNPLYKERTTHDCVFCKGFIRKIGKVVAVNKSGKLETVWDVNVGGTYQIVADALADAVKARPIAGIFRLEEQKVGMASNRQQIDTGDIITWHHFHAEVPKEFVLRRGQSYGDVHGDFLTNQAVLKRSVEEISLEAIDIVLELIDQNSLYRGQEHLKTVKDLREVKKAYDSKRGAKAKDVFLWTESVKQGMRSRFKNTVIGTLLVDISEGVDLETAVRSFETKVAPHNYKRPTALITQTMINKAQDTITELGLEDALQRRYAVEGDLTVNNVLFVDRSTQQKMKGGALDDLLKPTAKEKTPNLDKVQEIGIEEFIAKVLPKAESLEMFVENKHTSNLVSLIAPVNENAPGLFKWDNGFSWSYNGEVTDSIKERVKKAGGNVTGDVRVSLSWFNHDDLDLHVIEPSRNVIYFGNRVSRNTGGHLDVDMNAGGRMSREPVENIVWPNKNRMVKGDYEVAVHNFSKRETVDVGFELEVEIDGNVQVFSYTKAVRNGDRVNVLTLSNDGRTVKIKDAKVDSTSASKEVWGINTEQFQKVKMVMNSPNHWDGQTVGNKHWFFMLEDCANPEQARGFYNEFLTNELEKHRKVFEVLGSKMKAEESDQQLSGVGFSSTQENAILCRVRGAFNRTVKIKF